MHRRAFTLIELLVVISIIALLVAMLLPALRNARDASRTVVCGSNLRQLAVAEHTYAADHDDHLISYGRYAGGSSNPLNGSPWHYGQWVPAMLRQLEFNWELLECPSTVWRTDISWSYANVRRWDWHKDGEFVAHIPHPHRICLFAAIGKNGMLAFNEDRGGGWVNNYPRFDDFTQPANTIVFGDSQGGGLVGENPEGTLHNYTIGPGVHGHWYALSYPKRHNQRRTGNYVFGDGHTETIERSALYHNTALFRPAPGWPD